MNKPRPSEGSPRPSWIAAALAIVGMMMLLAFTVDRVLSGKPGDPTLVSAALALAGLSSWVGLDWLRRRNVP